MLLFLHFQIIMQVQQIKEEEGEEDLLVVEEEVQNVIIQLLMIVNIIQRLKNLCHSILNPFYNY